jgi:peptidylprolyl isomerase
MSKFSNSSLISLVCTLICTQGVFAFDETNAKATIPAPVFESITIDNPAIEEASSKHQAEMTYAFAAPEEIQQIDAIKLSETFGHLIGRNLEAPGFSFDMESVIRGMRKAAAGEPAPMTEEEYERAVTQLQEKTFNELSEKNMKEANAFLNANAMNTGVIQLENGKLQYKVLKEGAGAQVVSNGAPQLHYTGKYLNGTVFGSSIGGEPITLPLDQTIPGFSQGLVGMREGEKRILYIHPELGYGTSGHLQPNSLLVFEVELMKAETKATESQTTEPTAVSDPAISPTSSQ